MKKMVLAMVCFLTIAGAASAQTRNSRHRGSAPNSTITTSAVTHPTETATITQPGPDNSREATSTSMTIIPDNRTEYMQDGQLATFTGHEATAVNTDEFQSLRKNDNKRVKQ